MRIVEIGSLKMVHGDGLPRVGIVIECTKDEAMDCSRLLYKDIEIKGLGEKNSALKVLVSFMDRIANVDNRLREEKASKRYTRDEVLAMLDEIDPEFVANKEGVK